MVELTGTIADLRAGDYLDQIGDGQRFRITRVGRIVHRVQTGYAVTRQGVREVPGIELLGIRGLRTVRPDAPLTFRRFTD